MAGVHRSNINISPSRKYRKVKNVAMAVKSESNEQTQQPYAYKLMLQSEEIDFIPSQKNRVELELSF